MTPPVSYLLVDHCNEIEEHIPKVLVIVVIIPSAVLNTKCQAPKMLLMN
jgi:hypothetical protein